MSKVKKQLTIYVSPEIIERMDRLVDSKHYLPNRTFAITLAMLQYIEKEENYGGLKDTTTLPQ